MGVIREDLILADQFSASFSRFLSMGESAVNKMDQLSKTIEEVGESSRYVMVQGMNEINQTLQQIAQNTSQVSKEQQEHDDNIKKSSSSMDNLLASAKRVLTVVAGFKGAQKLLDFSDGIVQTQARLNMINDGLQSTAELQDKIYQSAMRTGSSYAEVADNVAKLGQRTGDIFKSNNELIQFTENLNKKFAIAGATQMEVTSATTQLTQALGSGVLRGQDFNSVMAAAPNIIQEIADYMGVSVGEMRDMAAEGQITADIVKNAMLGATDSIAEEFSKMPTTWRQTWNRMASTATRAMEEVGEKINDLLNSDAGQAMVEGIISGIQFLAEVASMAIDLIAGGAQLIYENWDVIQPLLVGLAVAFAALGAVSVAHALGSAAAWAIQNWQLTLIMVTIAALIYGLQAAGVSFEEMGAVAGGVLGGLYIIGYTVVAFLWNIFASFAEFFANVFNDPVAAIAHLFADLLDTILSIVETAASAIDALLGSDLSGAVSGFRGKIQDWVNETVGENSVKIERMDALGTDDMTNIVSEWSKGGAELGKKMDNLNFNMDDLLGGGSDLGVNMGSGAGSGSDLGNIGKVGSVGTVKNVEGEVSLSDEDVKMYRDLAEQKYLNKIELKTLAPNITVSIPDSAAGNLSAEDVADKLKVLLIEQMNASGAVAHG